MTMIAQSTKDAEGRSIVLRKGTRGDFASHLMVNGNTFQGVYSPTIQEATIIFLSRCDALGVKETSV
jgi:predicted aspartyl protease